MNMRTTMMRLTCSTALSAVALAVVLLISETRQLRRQIQHMEEERNQAVIAEFRRDWRSLPEDEKARMQEEHSFCSGRYKMHLTGM